MSYEVRIARQAERYLARLPRSAQERILQRLEQLAEDPLSRHSKPLQNHPGRRAARVGDWRIVFSVDSDAQRVDVSDIGPRGQVYRRL